MRIRRYEQRSMIYELRRSQATFNISSTFACAPYIFLYDVQLLSTYTHEYILKLHWVLPNIVFLQIQFAQFAHPRRVKCGNSQFIYPRTVQRNSIKIKDKFMIRKLQIHWENKIIWRTPDINGRIVEQSDLSNPDGMCKRWLHSISIQSTLT